MANAADVRAHGDNARHDRSRSECHAVLCNRVRQRRASVSGRDSSARSRYGDPRGDRFPRDDRRPVDDSVRLQWRRAGAAPRGAAGGDDHGAGRECARPADVDPLARCSTGQRVRWRDRPHAGWSRAWRVIHLYGALSGCGHLLVPPARARGPATGPRTLRRYRRSAERSWLLQPCESRGDVDALRRPGGWARRRAVRRRWRHARAHGPFWERPPRERRCALCAGRRPRRRGAVLRHERGEREAVQSVLFGGWDAYEGRGRRWRQVRARGVGRERRHRAVGTLRRRGAVSGDGVGCSRQSRAGAGPHHRIILVRDGYARHRSRGHSRGDALVHAAVRNASDECRRRVERWSVPRRVRAASRPRPGADDARAESAVSGVQHAARHQCGDRVERRHADDELARHEQRGELGAPRSGDGQGEHGHRLALPAGRCREAPHLQRPVLESRDGPSDSSARPAFPRR